MSGAPHQYKRLLHVLDLLAGTAEHVVTVAGKLTDIAGCGIWMKTRLQQAVAVHKHNLLSISLVCLLARDVLHVLRIGQQHIKPLLLKEKYSSTQ